MTTTLTKSHIGVEDITWYDGTQTFTRKTTTGGLITLNKVGPSINVDYPPFNAKGDGVTDDTAAIQTAINAFPSSGGNLIMPSPNYLTSSKILLNKPIHMFGMGVSSATGPVVGTTTIKKTATFPNEAGIEITGAKAEVSHINVDGTSGNQGMGIWIKTNGIKLIDVGTFNQGSHGIFIGVPADITNCNSFYLESVRSRLNGGDGVHVESNMVDIPNANANAGTMINVDASYNTDDGIDLESGVRNTLIGFLTGGNTGYGIRLNAANACYIIGGDVNEANGTYDLFLHSTAINNYIVTDVLASRFWYQGTNNTVIGQDFTIIRDLYEYNYKGTLADEGTLTLPTSTNGGWGFAQIGNAQEYGQFSFTTTADVTLIANSTNTVNTNTDTKFCIYDGGTNVIVKNRLGSSKTIMVKLFYN